jgi:hypothetical protein
MAARGAGVSAVFRGLSLLIFKELTALRETIVASFVLADELLLSQASLVRLCYSICGDA